MQSGLKRMTGICCGDVQSSPYSYHSDMYKEGLEPVYKTCDLSDPTDIPPPLVSEPEQSTLCVSENCYTTILNGETCGQVVYLKNVLTVVLYHINLKIFHCSDISSGEKLCLPFFCVWIIPFSKNDTCIGLRHKYKLYLGDVCRFNM